MPRCPYCSNTVSSDAFNCSTCGAILGGTPGAPNVPVTVMAGPIEQEKKNHPVIIIVVVVSFMFFLLPILALLWIDSIQDEITSQAEQQVMESFQQGTLQVISAYECEGGKVPGCQVPGNLCLLVRNTGKTVMRLTDLGSAQVVYELHEAPEMGERPVMSKSIGATFSNVGGRNPCCSFSTLAINGNCGGKGVIDSRETFIIGFTGKFRGADGTVRDMTYDIAKRERIILSFNLPSGSKMSHQIV